MNKSINISNVDIDNIHSSSIYLCNVSSICLIEIIIMPLALNSLIITAILRLLMKFIKLTKFIYQDIHGSVNVNYNALQNAAQRTGNIKIWSAGTSQIYYMTSLCCCCCLLFCSWHYWMKAKWGGGGERWQWTRTRHACDGPLPQV